jgi:hypothetical protein
MSNYVTELSLSLVRKSIKNTASSPANRRVSWLGEKYIILPSLMKLR